MPWIVAILIRGLVWAASSFFGQALVGLGIGVVTYTGTRVLLGSYKAQAVAAFVGLGPDVLGLLGVLRVGQCINVLFSALLIRATLNGLQSDTIKRFMKK
ncbi:DUF2523 domain-containing protein [Variovorax sp. Varisp36]|uniref:DUF2523 domain-containing protein n=1 Tax=Variovorax sp. Varisp36 TaxID=3243031 RepID=UPI0039A70965